MARVAFVIVLFVLRSGRRAQFPACLEREEGAGTGGGATGGRFTETRSCDHDSESVSVFSLLLFFSSSGRPATHQNIASVPLADDNYVVMIIVALSCTYCMYVRMYTRHRRCSASLPPASLKVELETCRLAFVLLVTRLSFHGRRFDN